MSKSKELIHATCIITNFYVNKRKSIHGIIRLKETNNNKVKIIGTIEGLTPGYHGFHIHKTGDLSKGCDSLCDHYNPFNCSHGGPKDKIRHVGDLGNIYANKDGVAKINMTDHLVKLSGRYSVIGRSLIVHQDKDDLGKGGHNDSLTTGHAGKRIACGIIGILQ
jgi:superoxide dismutase, Cu-Zn family